MREFYFEDKVGHFSIIGASPHDDVNCKPLDYFTYNHAYVVARTFMQVASYKKDLSNIDERYFFEFALEQTKENNDRIQYSTYPQAGLQQILAHHEWDKHQQKKLWEGVVLSATDIWWFNWLAQEIGYLLDVFHIEIIPRVFQEKKLPMCFTQENDGRFRKIGTTDLSEGEMRGILEQRKVLQMRVYHRESIWHCFYFTHRGLAGKEPGTYGSVPHYHYISDKFGIPLVNLKKRFSEGKMPSSEIHIQIKK